jgi:hypothetical protein
LVLVTQLVNISASWFVILQCSYFNVSSYRSVCSLEAAHHGHNHRSSLWGESISSLDPCIENFHTPIVLTIPKIQIIQQETHLLYMFNISVRSVSDSL